MSPHPPDLLAQAHLAYLRGQLPEARDLLDQLIAVQPANVAALELRNKVAEDMVEFDLRNNERWEREMDAGVSGATVGTRGLNPDAPDDSRQLLTFVGGVFVILWALYMLIRWLFYPPAPFVRYHVLSSDSGGCRAEGWVAGKEGDFLARLVGHGKRGRSWVEGCAIIHKNGTSTGLSSTIKTDQGTCQVTRYHLLINGNEADSLNAQREPGSLYGGRRY